MTRKPDRRAAEPAGAAAPSSDDADIWRRLSETVKPLPGKVRKPVARPKPQPAAAAPTVANPPPPAPAPTAPAPPRPADLLLGRRRTIAGLDRRKADRLRRGELAIDARLDLHGMTQEAAHAALNRFIEQAAARDHRCLLVITGKGTPRRSEDDAGRPVRSGILRGAVPRWLAEPGLRPLIVAVHPAAMQHGGDGALYVLLKRKR
ncbi:MAG TPA: Smr/MutS family protein [Candidatus Sulfotelmatobacter sp.]|nr:Smr/MutS family protein [Candidatus Sulfotelmatobacter sp.]